jgi:hypothetical protein
MSQGRSIISNLMMVWMLLLAGAKGADRGALVSLPGHHDRRN